MQFNWDNLAQNSIPQLKAEAEALSIFIPPRTKKSEIIRILEQEKPRLLSPPPTPIMSVNSRYEKRFSPSNEKVDIHEEAVQSMRRKPMPSTPASFLAQVYIETASPLPKERHISPVLGSPLSVPLTARSTSTLHGGIDIDSVPSLSSSTSSSALSSTPSSRLVSPLPQPCFSTPIVTRERCITPLQSPKINNYYSQYRVSTYTKVMSVILSISTAVFLVLSITNPLFLPFFGISFVLLILVFLLKRYEIKSKSKSLVTAMRSFSNVSSMKTSFNADNDVYKNALKLLKSNEK